MNNLNRTYLHPPISWTDKLTICANGEIVEDCSGKIVGYVKPKVYKELTKFDYNEEDSRQ